MKTLALSDQIPFLSPMSSAEGGGPARAADARLLPEGQETFETILAESSPLPKGPADPEAEPSTPRPDTAQDCEAAAAMQDLARPTAEAAVVASLQGALQIPPITADPATASQADSDLSRALSADTTKAETPGAPDLPHRQKLSAADPAGAAAITTGKDASNGPAKERGAADTSAPAEKTPPATDGAETAAMPVPLGEASTVSLSAEADSRTKAAQAFASMASISASTPPAGPTQIIPPETLPGTGPVRIAQTQQAAPEKAAAESGAVSRTEALRPTAGETGGTDAPRQESKAATAPSDGPTKAVLNAELPPGPVVAPVTAPHLSRATSARPAQAAEVTGMAGTQPPRLKAEAAQSAPRKAFPVADTSAPGPAQGIEQAKAKAAEATQPPGATAVTVQTVATAQGPVPAAIPMTASLAESRIKAALASVPTETGASPEPVAAGAATPAADKAGAAAPIAAAVPQPAPGPGDDTPPRAARLRETAEAAPGRDRAPAAAQAPVAEAAVKATETAAAPATPTPEGSAPTTSASAPLSFSAPLGAERAGQLTGGNEAAAAHRAASPHAIAHQMSQALADAGNRTVELTLSPEELGKVRMTLTSSDGAITVAVQAERPETLDLMRRNIESLARDFRDMGYSNIGFDFGQQTDQRPSAQERAAESALQPAAPERDGPTRFESFPTPLQAPPGTASGGLDLRI